MVSFCFCVLMDLAFPQSLNLKRKNFTNTYPIQTHSYKFNNICRHIGFGHTWIPFSNNFGPKHYQILFAPGGNMQQWFIISSGKSRFLEPPNNSNQKLLSLDWFPCSFNPDILNFWFFELTIISFKDLRNQDSTVPYILNYLNSY